MYLVGDEGDNILVGGADADTIIGNGGNDFLVGNGGGDIIDGGDGNDVLVTYIGPTSSLQPASLLIGGAGNDSLESRNANDTLLGGDGDDVFSVFNYATTRTLDGGAGVDTLVFADSLTSFAAGVTMNLNKGTQTVASGVVLITTAIENLTGTAAADTLIGDANANRLSGSAGNDLLIGQDGADTLIGGAGDDTLDGGAGRDTISYENYGPVAGPVSVNLAVGSSTSAAHGNDTLILIEDVIGTLYDDSLVGSAGDNHLAGGAGNDFLVGLGGGDIIEGGDGNDYLTTLIGFSPLQPGSLLVGGAGNDLLESRNADDTLLGGDGDDNFSVFNYATTRTLDGGAGVDTLAFADSLTSFAAGVTMNLNKGTQTVASGVVLITTAIENLTGTAAADTLIGDANANRLAGSGGNDLLIGQDGADTLIGGAGDDTLDGGAGRDILDGQGGGDTYVFAPGDSIADPIGGGVDVIQGFSNGDRLVFNGLTAPSAANYEEEISSDFSSAVDQFTARLPLYGTLYAAYQVAGDVYVFAGTDSGPTPGIQNVVKLLGANLGNLGADLTFTPTNWVGTASADILVGDTNGNTLSGLGGDDTLIAGGGDDTLIGGAGQDTLIGQTGSDTYVFASGDSVADPTGGGVDVIQGFEAGDRLVFTGMITPSSANYGEGASADFAAAAAQVNSLLPLFGTLYATYQIGSDVYVFAATTAGPTPGIQDVIKLQGVTTADIGVDQIFGS